MFRFITARRTGAKDQADYWLAGQFDRRPHLSRDRAIAAWSEHLGRTSADLWLEACASQGRGR